MSYTPADTIEDQEVRRELQEVAKEMESLRSMAVLHRSPVKPRKGNFCICDGVDWNPLGDGQENAIYFNGTIWRRF